MFVSEIQSLESNSCNMLVFRRTTLWSCAGVMGCVFEWNRLLGHFLFPHSYSGLSTIHSGGVEMHRFSSQRGGNVLPDRSNELLSFFKERMETHKLSMWGGGVS